MNRQSHRIVDVTKAAAEDDPERRAGIKEYEDYKESFAKNIQFDGKRANKSKLINISNTSALNIFLLQKVTFLTPASSFISQWAVLPMTGSNLNFSVWVVFILVVFILFSG